MTRPGRPIVFIHGLWKSAEIWDRWVDYFSLENYRAQAMLWPGEKATAAATRSSSAGVIPYSFEDLRHHIESQIAELDEAPICIGHSFGALIAERLLASGAAVAAVAIDPAEPGSVLPGSIERLRSVPFETSRQDAERRLVTLTRDQFRDSFMADVDDDHAEDLYERYAIPGSARILFEALDADFTLIPDVARRVSGPLLLLPSEHPVDGVPGTHDSSILAFRDSISVEVNYEFAGRGHSLVFDQGWETVADVVISWLEQKGL